MADKADFEDMQIKRYFHGELYMCVLCGNKIYTKNELDKWLVESSYDDAMPSNIIYKDIVNNYLYSKVNDHYYNEDTRTLINYCPVCGEKLV